MTSVSGRFAAAFETWAVGSSTLGSAGAVLCARLACCGEVCGDTASCRSAGRPPPASQIPPAAPTSVAATTTKRVSKNSPSGMFLRAGGECFAVAKTCDPMAIATTYSAAGLSGSLKHGRTGIDPGQSNTHLVNEALSQITWFAPEKSTVMVTCSRSRQQSLNSASSGDCSRLKTGSPGERSHPDGPISDRER